MPIFSIYFLYFFQILSIIIFKIRLFQDVRKIKSLLRVYIVLIHFNRCRTEKKQRQSLLTIMVLLECNAFVYQKRQNYLPQKNLFVNEIMLNFLKTSLKYFHIDFFYCNNTLKIFFLSLLFQ